MLMFFSRNGSPILVTLVSFWHFAVYRNQALTPSIAFTSILGKVQLPQLLSSLIKEIFYSLFRDEVCPQCSARDIYQHASGKKSSRYTQSYTHSIIRALYHSVVSKNIWTAPRWKQYLLSINNQKQSPSNHAPPPGRRTAQGQAKLHQLLRLQDTSSCSWICHSISQRENCRSSVES